MIVLEYRRRKFKLNELVFYLNQNNVQDEDGRVNFLLRHDHHDHRGRHAHLHAHHGRVRRAGSRKDNVSQ